MGQVDYAKLAAQHGGKAVSAGNVDEPAFRRWYAGAAKQYDLNPDPDSAGQFYDYRAAFKADAKPDETGHWPSQFKKAGHPAMIVGGFHVQTGERVPGTPRAKDAAELVQLGWDPQTAEKLARAPEPAINYAALAREVRGETGTAASPAEEPSLLSRAVGAVGDVAIGAVKGVGNTVFGLGKLTRDYTPIGRISDAIHPGAFDRRPAVLEPTNTAQRIGHTAEQIGEFFLPTGAPAKLAKAAEVAKSGALSLTQSGSPMAAGVSAGLTAVMPGGGALRRGASALETSAEKSMAQALGATKEWAKSDAAKVAPGMLARGVRGSRPAMLEQARGKLKEVGAKIGAEVQAAAAAGKTVDGLVTRGNIQLTRDVLMVTNAAGTLVPIEGAQAVVKKLDKLDAFVAQLGDEIPFEKANKIKGVWDRIVSKAGLYGPKATASSTDNANAWAIREAATGFRDLLAKGSPTLDDLNREYAFWKGLKGVLVETQKRTQAQGGGLVSGVTGASGAAAGFASGDSIGDSFQKALVGGVMGRQVVKLVQSPQWRTTVSGPLKQALATALATGNQGAVMGAISRITSAMPAQMRTATAQ